MKIHELEAIDMGDNQQEIAEKVLSMVAEQNFKSEDEFFEIEGELITKACKELGWTSVPQTGGFVVNWNSEDG